MPEQKIARPLWVAQPLPADIKLLPVLELRVVVKSSDPPKFRKRRRPIAPLVIGPGPFHLFRVW